MKQIAGVQGQRRMCIYQLDTFEEFESLVRGGESTAFLIFTGIHDDTEKVQGLLRRWDIRKISDEMRELKKTQQEAFKGEDEDHAFIDITVFQPHMQQTCWGYLRVNKEQAEFIALMQKRSVENITKTWG
jgi:hypothetical protein